MPPHPTPDTVADKFVVTGGADGAVRFFDFQFRVVGWFEDLAQGPVTSVSFAENMPRKAAAEEGAGEITATFNVPDFVVATEHGRVVRVASAMMDRISKQDRRGEVRSFV
jgi:hypothetical protein